MMRRILVTGANGYLGGHVLSRARAHGLEIYGTSRIGGANLIACDLRNAGTFKPLVEAHGFDTIIHCAAYVPKSAAAYDDRCSADENLTMIDALIAARPRRLVFASSMTVYGRSTPMPAREDSADGGVTLYSKDKLAAERRLTELAHDIACLRLPGLFGGTRRGGLLHTVARAFSVGQIPAITADPPLWAALHVDDAAELCLRAAQYDAPLPRTMNSGYEDPMSVATAVAALAARFNRPPPQMPEAPLFEMDLQRLKSTLGLPSSTFDERLDELCRTARAAV